MVNSIRVLFIIRGTILNNYYYENQVDKILSTSGCRQSRQLLIFRLKLYWVIKMMTRKDVDNRFQIEFNSVDTLVPKNHLVRKIDKAIDFNFIYDEVAELYSAFGQCRQLKEIYIKVIKNASQ